MAAPSNTKNIDDADDVNNNTNAENAENADNTDDAENADDVNNAENAENAENAKNAENADCWSVPSPYHVTWPISRLPAPINFIYKQHPSLIVLKSNTPTLINYKRQIG